MLYWLKLILNSDQYLTLFTQKQILTVLLVTKVYKNRTMKISLFNYAILGYILPIKTYLPYIYRRRSCPMHIFKPTHQAWLVASSHRGIFQTNLPFIRDLCRFLQPGLISSTIFCKELDFTTASINHNRDIKLHWDQFPMIGNTYSEMKFLKNLF